MKSIKANSNDSESYRWPFLQLWIMEAFLVRLSFKECHQQWLLVLRPSWAPHFWLIQTHKYEGSFPKVAFMNNDITVTKPSRVQGSRPNFRWKARTIMSQLFTNSRNHVSKHQNKQLTAADRFKLNEVNKVQNNYSIFSNKEEEVYFWDKAFEKVQCEWRLMNRIALSPHTRPHTGVKWTLSEQQNTLWYFTIF